MIHIEWEQQELRLPFPIELIEIVSFHKSVSLFAIDIIGGTLNKD